MKEHFYLKLMTAEKEVNSNIEIKLKEDNIEILAPEEINPGEYLLSALQAMLLNKKMPFGYKLELEEVYQKSSLENLKNQKINSAVGKKRKTNNVPDTIFLIIFMCYLAFPR